MSNTRNGSLFTPKVKDPQANYQACAQAMIELIGCTTWFKKDISERSALISKIIDDAITQYSNKSYLKSRLAELERLKQPLETFDGSKSTIFLQEFIKFLLVKGPEISSASRCLIDSWLSQCVQYRSITENEQIEASYFWVKANLISHSYEVLKLQIIEQAGNLIRQKHCQEFSIPKVDIAAEMKEARNVPLKDRLAQLETAIKHPIKKPAIDLPEVDKSHERAVLDTFFSKRKELPKLVEDSHKSAKYSP